MKKLTLVIVALVSFMYLTVGVSQEPALNPFMNRGGLDIDLEADSNVIGNPKADLDPIWLYVTTKANEIEELGRLEHTETELGVDVESELTELILVYDKLYRDNEIDRRIERMCEDYKRLLSSMSPEDSAAIAIRHMETGEQLRARRKDVSDRFVRQVQQDVGITHVGSIMKEAHIQASYIATYSVETTRDWIEKMNLDKVGYMRNACGF